MKGGHVALAFRILQMLQALRQSGSGEKSLLEDKDGVTLLVGFFFHQELSPAWRRLVLAAGVLDLHPEAFTPLSQAISLGQDGEAVEVLLEAGADPGHGDHFASVPLVGCTHSAVAHPVEKMDALLRHGADPNQIPLDEDDCAVSALHWAVRQNMSTAVLKLLAHPATDPDLICPRWCGSPLTTAALDFLMHRKNPGDMVRLLAAQDCRMLMRTDARAGAEDCGNNIEQLMSAVTDRWTLSRLKDTSDERKAQLRVLLEEGRMEAAKRKAQSAPDNLDLLWQQTCRFL